MSFLTLGVFWVGQQTQLHHLRRTNRDFTWIHLVFLLFVVLMPFSTTLVADYITDQLAIVVYWLNIALLGAILYAGQRYARRARLLKDDVTAATVAAMERRIVVYQALRVNPVRGRAREDQQQADARRSDPGVRPVDEERVIGGQQGVCGRASKWTSESPSRATASPASSSSARTASWAPAQEESAASPRRAAGCWRACPSRRFGAAHEAAPRARA
jgi:hypothetical protein